MRKLLFAAAILAAAGMALNGGALASAQQHGKSGHGPSQAQQKEKGGNPGKGKPHKNVNGKDLVGDKLQHGNGHFKLQDHGKFSSSIDVQNGKIAGFKVKHSEKGDVPVTKYKSSKQMAMGSRPGVQFASNAYADT